MCGTCEGMNSMQGFLRISDSQILPRGVGRMMTELQFFCDARDTEIDLIEAT